MNQFITPKEPGAAPPDKPAKKRKPRKKKPEPQWPFVQHALQGWDERNDFRVLRKRYGDTVIFVLRENKAGVLERAAVYITGQREQALKHYANKKCRIFNLNEKGELELLRENTGG